MKSLILALSPIALCLPAAASDVLVEATGTVFSNSYTQGPFNGTAAGDPVTFTCWVTTPGVVVSPGQFENYPIDVPRFAVTTPTGSVGLSASPHNLGIQNDFPVADGVRLFQTQTDQPGMWIIFELGNTAGDMFSSTDLTRNAGTWDTSYFGSMTWEFFGGGGSMSVQLVDITVNPPGGVLSGTYCSANPNSTGLPGSISGFGTTAVADNNLTLIADDLPTTQFGYFLASQNQGFVPIPGGSQGNLCIAAPIGRFTSQVQNSGNAGSISIPVDLTQIPMSPAVAVVPGETWNFQAWYRDTNPGSTSNFTNGLSVPFN